MFMGAVKDMRKHFKLYNPSNMEMKISNLCCHKKGQSRQTKQGTRTYRELKNYTQENYKINFPVLIHFLNWMNPV